MALRKPSEIEPGAMRAGLLAVLVHVIFFAFMIFGLNWKTYPTEPVMVDLWSSLPPAVQPAVKAAPPPPEPKPVQQPPEPVPVPPKIETPPPPKVDIALKEKIEKPKPVEKKPVEKKELVKKEQEQKERKEKERKEKEQKEQELKEQKARVAAEIAQLQREQQEASAKAQAKAVQAAAQSRLANEMAEYKAKILAKIRRNIVMPPDLPGDPVVEFDVTLLPGGDILDVRLRASSGFAAFDSAVERGIFLSKPLPLPPDPALFPKFRNLNVKVHYHE